MSMYYSILLRTFYGPVFAGLDRTQPQRKKITGLVQFKFQIFKKYFGYKLFRAVQSN